MLFIQTFKNYAEFQQIFGVREFEGEKTRKNKILLSLLKDEETHKRAIKTGDFTLLSIKNMVDLRNICTRKISKSGAKSRKLRYKLNLLGISYYSNIYSLDNMNGICEDGTPNAIRYINHENNREWKMKCGKFMKHLIQSTKFGKTLPESILIWLCEEFSRDWQSHVIGKLPKNKLYINDNFADIYDSKRLKGYNEKSDCFVSCMVNKGFHSFYKDSVKAKAAYLEDENGMIIARCIIWPEVYDEDGKVWRYAERQYSYMCNDVYKQALVDALIQAGKIDCYKKIGAACSDSTAIVDIKGNSLAEKKFYVDCDLDCDDTLSYQDTFKWYSMYNHKAYNYVAGDYDLDVTDGSLSDADNNGDDEPSEWDSFHERYVYEVCTVFYHGGEETCDIDNRDNFELFNGEWYHNDDIVKCPECGTKMLNPKYYDENDNVFQSDITGKAYCCLDCREKAKDKYMKENWYYSDYDNEWFEDKNDITTYHRYNCITCEYEDKTISKETLNELLEKGELYEWGQQYFNVINEEVGKPFGYETLLEFAA